MSLDTFAIIVLNGTYDALELPDSQKQRIWSASHVPKIKSNNTSRLDSTLHQLEIAAYERLICAGHRYQSVMII